LFKDYLAPVEQFLDKEESKISESGKLFLGAFLKLKELIYLMTNTRIDEEIQPCPRRYYGIS
jgi:hypothetical protein